MKTMSLTQFLSEPTTPEQFLKGFNEPINNGLQDSLKEIVEPLKNINNFLDYITNPKKIIYVVLTWIINNSYQVCLIGALLALIFYIAGHKKALKYVPIMLTIYVLLQAIGGYLK